MGCRDLNRSEFVKFDVGQFVCVSARATGVSTVARRLVLRGPEVERNAEAWTRSVKYVNCRETIGAQGSGSGTECGSLDKKRQKREL